VETIVGRPYKDLTGQRFGFLTALRDAGRSKSGDVLWECECSCQEHNHIITTSSNLQRLHTQSCGCYCKSQISKTHTKEVRFEVVDDIAIGYTSNNEQFFVDVDDVDKLKGHSWWYTSSGYVAGYIDGHLVLMHRFLTNCDDDHVVDHKNHITGDNRKENLRICTVSENQYNRRMQNNNTSGVIGVSWDKRYSKWRAYIAVDKERIELGSFNNIDDAINARRQAEMTYHREFAFSSSIIGGDVNE
jgi:hypothetical protein